MKRPFIRVDALSLPRQRRSSLAEERGVTIILVAFAMIGILGMAALSIDVITLYLARLEAQRSADAAALTAARIISISGITGTADPGTDPGDWTQICGGPGSVASQAAQAVAYQNTVAGIPATSITVNYSGGGSGPSTSCSGLPTAFAVNPMVTVQVKRTGLPSFFARIWGGPSDTVTASATAEAFNPSASDLNTNGGPTGTVTPVQPRCVKPWVVPNQDPFHPGGCLSPGCNPFVVRSGALASSIQNPGISVGGGGATGVIGETFNLFADCPPGPSCNLALVNLPPIANVPVGIPFVSGTPPAMPPPNLEYVPGAVPSSSTAAPSCGSGSPFQEAVAGCDQTTQYQCGVTGGGGYTLDLNNNPGGSTGDTAVATQCLIHQAAQGPGPLDADNLNTGAFPFKITAGTGNPVTGVQGSLVTASNSIVSLPIYDSNVPLLVGTTPPVTIVGFLQVFINYVNTDGSLNVTVLNVAGCGNGTNPTGNPVNGSSPVPVRLVQ